MNGSTRVRHEGERAGNIGRRSAWRLRASAVLTFYLALLCSVPASASAAEGPTHLLDATLSLTGNCATNTLDPVPDPGCPGGSHPSRRFKVPRSETTDEFGDIYVASTGINPSAEAAEAVIDIFDSSGTFLTEIPDHRGAERVAVDSEGNLYVYRFDPDVSLRAEEVVLYEPELYEPQDGEIRYAEAPSVVLSGAPIGTSIAVDRSNDRLYVDLQDRIQEFGSVAEGNQLVDGSIGEGTLSGSTWFAVNASSDEIYASTEDTSASNPPAAPAIVDVLSGEAAHPLIRTIDGSCLPEGHFGANGSTGLSVALDESTGHVFVDDRGTTNFEHEAVDEFTESGNCVSTIEHGFEYAFRSQIAIDNGAESPNGALDADGRYLFVPSGEVGNKSHVYAFAPAARAHAAPAVEKIAATAIGTTEAQLTATVNPRGYATHYTIEYTSQASFEAEGFQGASVAGEGELSAATLGIEVSAGVANLSPGSLYRYRVVAESDCEVGGCRGEAERGFSTFSIVSQAGACGNAELRAGPSARLPDCRAFELVTPPDSGGRALFDTGQSFAGDRFGSLTDSPDGSSLAFMTFGGAIAGTEGAGGFNGTPYVATRTVDGWSTEGVGMSGTQSSNPSPGSLSSDHGYALSTAAEAGSLPIGGRNTTYIRYPDGEFHLLGQGSVGVQPLVQAEFVAPGGTHAIFSTALTGATPQRLEPGAPPTGTGAIYDRTSDGGLHVASLLPGDITPSAGENATFEGVSTDGTAIAFDVGGRLYVRLDDSRTVEVGADGATLAGMSSNGRYVFYLLGGDLFRDDTEDGSTTRITESADVGVVNVPADGASVYFVSSRVLTLDENPNGASAVSGEKNLYYWDDTGLRFVATLTARDVEGESGGSGSTQLDGLGLWVKALPEGEQAIDPSRSTAGGTTFVFESRASLTSYDANGKAEIYRYEISEPTTLRCISCDPTGIDPRSDASLQSVSKLGGGEETPTGRFALIPNLSADGERLFFETADPLVPQDTDGVQDVYEWEADGVGTCATQAGCLFLISSGQSAHANYLFGVSESGDDVFISTSDLLVPADGDETPSIYDARVEGGFRTGQQAAECIGEACQPTAVVPGETTPASSTYDGPGNLRPNGHKTGCRSGRKKVKEGKKTRCIKKKSGKPRHRKKHEPHRRGRAQRRAGTDGRPGR